jgi:hypothetical protein
MTTEQARRARVLADAIEQHRDARYHGGVVISPVDRDLYAALVWWQTTESQDGSDVETPVDPRRPLTRDEWATLRAQMDWPT